MLEVVGGWLRVRGFGVVCFFGFAFGIGFWVGGWNGVADWLVGEFCIPHSVRVSVSGALLFWNGRTERTNGAARKRGDIDRKATTEPNKQTDGSQTHGH